MNQDKKSTIKDVFESNQHKLNQQPHPRVWNRLEDRLDRHSKTDRNLRLLRQQYRWRIAASFLLVIGLVGLLIAYGRLEDRAPALADYHPPTGLEALPAFDATSNNVPSIDRKLYANLERPIVEGEIGRHPAPSNVLYRK